ncbi:MAG TPA: ABC transporter ATP-binding protein [Methanomicrobia archaeon]|nr:ABC transporter ATP-binding protein [Methanomicrobia archaeon]
MHNVTTVDTMEPAIKLNDLTKRYTFKILALKGISLEIDQGECVGFLGPNGAGKSTTIKILTGLIRPTDGTAFLNGHDIRKNKKEALRSVGCVVETPDFYPYLTPIDTLNYLGNLRGVDGLEGRIEEVLDLVNLQDWADTRVGSFSKGMKQRLGLAQALLHDPQLLILDEPSSGLDPKGMAEIRQLINKLKHEKTIFLSSHLLSEVQQIADKVALINKGEILAYDTMRGLSSKLSGVQEATIETLSPLTEEQLETVRSHPIVKDIKLTDVKHYLLIFQGETEECRMDLMRELIDRGIPLTAFTPKGLGLEDIYMEMIQ